MQYVARAGNYAKKGILYQGINKVVKTILAYDYLWNEVRVKGGAYGTGMSCSGTGMMQAYSYRDPDVLNSMRAFKGAQ